MAQVAILVNGSPDPRKAELAKTLALVLGCPVLSPKPIEESLAAQTGPMADPARLASLAGDTVWRTAGLVEAGVVIEASYSADRATAVKAGLLLSGSPRLVEVFCGEGEPLGLTPFVAVDFDDDVDMDALVVEIGALFS